MTRLNRRTFMHAAAALLLATGGTAGAVDWPDKPLRIIHGGGPGSNSDLIARSAGQQLAGRLGQSIVVEPRSGAGQSLAMVAVARSAPDGYTLAMLNAGIVIQTAISSKLPYNLRTDFEPIAMLSSFPVVIAVRADGPYRTLADLIEAARKAPGQLTFGAMVGTTQHLTGEMFASAAGIQWANVPYPGSAGQITDLLGGRLDAVVDSLTALMGQIKGGQLRALAVSSAQRWPTLPDVPAVAETIRGFDVTSWTGLAVPAGTPAAIRERLEREVREVVASEAYAAQVRSYGSEPHDMGAADMKRYILGDIDRWKAVADAAKIKMD